MNKFQHMGTLKYNKAFNTRGHTYLTCRLYYQRIIHKYKCLSSLFFSFFLLEIERERGYVIAVLGKGVGRNSLNGLLSFSTTGFFWEYFLFYGLAGFFTALAWRHQFLLSKILSAFSPGVWHETRPCVHGGCRPLNWYSLSLFPLTKKGTTSALEYWPIIRPFSLTIRSQNANIWWLSFWPGFVTSAASNWPTFLFLFLTVSLWRSVNSNTEG